MKKVYNGHSKSGGVYKIINLKSEKIYIGSTKNFKKRAHQHESQLKKQKHSNRHLQASWNKYGKDVFLFEVIEVVEGNKLDRTTREQELLNEQLENWELCFNIAKKTVRKKGPWSKTPEETRKLRSKRSKKMWECLKHKRKVAQAMEKHYIQQVKILNKYRPIAIKNSNEKRRRSYGKIIDPAGKVHNIGNIKAFARKYNLNRANLQKVIEGKHPSCKGWRRYESSLEGKPYVRQPDHRAKKFTIVDPEGKIYTDVNITQFAKKHELNKENLSAVIRGTRKSHKGWKKIKD